MTTREDILKMTHDQRRDWWAMQPENGGWLPPGTNLTGHDGSICTIGSWARKNINTLTSLGYDDGGTGSRAVAVPRHPLPDTLDAIAAAFPKGWTWWMGYRALFARKPGVWKGLETPTLLRVKRTDDERHDRLLLACLARAADMDGKQ